jgi:hypothetical protein
MNAPHLLRASSSTSTPRFRASGARGLLSEIDDIDWRVLPAAEGFATGLEDDLRALVVAPSSKHPRAARRLLRRLLVRAGWTEAGARATPILLELARLAGHPARATALALLGDLAAGDHLPRLGFGVDTRARDWDGWLAHTPAGAIHDDLARGAETLAASLGDEDPDVRGAAAFALAFCSGRAEACWDELWCAALQERDPWALGSALLALGHVARYRGAPPAELREALGSIAMLRGAGEGPAIARALAWIAETCAWTSGSPAPRAPAGLADDVATMLRATPAPAARFPWGRGRLERLVMLAAHRAEESTRLELACALATVAAQGGGGSAARAQIAMRLGFESSTIAGARWIRASDLDARRARLVGLLSQPDAPRIPFARFGLPAGAHERRRYLGLDEASALELSALLPDGYEGQLWQLLRAQLGPFAAEELPALRSATWGVITARFPAHDPRRLEAAAHLRLGAHGLGPVATLDDLWAAVDAAGPAGARWIEARGATLRAYGPAALRASGAGAACAFTLACAGLPLDEAWDEGCDLAPTVERLAAILDALPPARRERLVLRAIARSIGCAEDAHRTLRRLSQLHARVATEAVTAAALELADVTERSAHLSRRAPPDAAEVRARLREAYGRSDVTARSRTP